MAETDNTQQKRQVAYKTRISELLNNEYVKNEGFVPSYVVDRFGRNITRVNIIATVVSNISQEGMAESMIVDDGSGRIQVRSFDETTKIPELDPGSIVTIIGKVREYSSERYIIPEVIKELMDSRWIEYRKLELEILDKSSPEKEPEKAAPVEPIITNEKPATAETEEETIDFSGENKKEEKKNSADIVFETIKEIDTGDGAFIEDIISKSKIKDAEKIIENLLMQGDIFEISPGKVKVLE